MFAEAEDVKDRWLGTTELPDDDVIEKWLEDAELLITAEYPDIPDRIAQDPTGSLEAKARFVAVQLTIQALRNPDGIRQRAQTAGSFTDSVTYGSETINAAMTLTPAHRALLAPGSESRAFGIDMTEHKTTPHPLERAWVNGPAGFEPGAAP